MPYVRPLAAAGCIIKLFYHIVIAQMSARLIALFCLALVCLSTADAYITNSRYVMPQRGSSILRFSSRSTDAGSATKSSLKNIIGAFSAVILISNSFSDAAFAKDSTGTKSDKGFELCLSKCTFAASRPPPAGSPTERLTVTMTRGETITMCKQKCAKTKEQTMIGEPKKNKVPKAESTQNE